MLAQDGNEERDTIKESDKIKLKLKSGNLKMMLNILTENPVVVKYFTQLKRDPTDSGLDLVIPVDLIVPANARAFEINHRIRCEMTDIYPLTSVAFGFPEGKHTYFPYLLYSRSSISNTPLILANGVGVMDAGYRGDVIAKVHNLNNEPYLIKAGSRLFQICAPTLLPIQYRLVSSLSPSTRGTNGFGSTN